MNVIRKLTLNSVKKNGKRSAATVIAIILSTALICGTAGLCTSALRSFANNARYQTGDFHLTVENIKRDEAGQITENAQVRDHFYTKSLGYGVLEGSLNREKPYVYVYALSSRAFSGGWGVHLKEGRMPQNEKEIVIPDHLRYDARVNYNIGDTLSFSLGSRVDAKGDPLTQRVPFEAEGTERLTNTAEYTFTVVGVADRPDWTLEDYSAPGYSCFTYAADEALAAADPVNVSFTLKNGMLYDSFKQTLFENLTAYGQVIENKDLLEVSGALRARTLQFLFAVGAIVTLIIMATSVFVIRNSFAISVSEQIRQYGILASVGATAKQIRKSVLFEGLLYGVVGIPLGVGSGMLAVAVLMKIVNQLIGDLLDGIIFVYWLPLPFVLASAVLAAVTIFFSALIPAWRAGKIPPIEAVRGNREVNVRKKEVKVSALTQKLFGVGGVIAAKNLKRSRKKYRTTVVSLVLSVTVFISLSSFVGYMKKSVSNQFEENSYNLSVYLGDETRNKEEAYKAMAERVNASAYSYYYLGNAYCNLNDYASAAEKRENEANLLKALKETDASDEFALSEQELREIYARMFLVVTAYNADYFAYFLKQQGVTGDPDSAVVICDPNRKLAVKPGDTMVVSFVPQITEEDEPVEDQVRTVTVNKVISDGHPMGLEGFSRSGAMLIVSENYFKNESVPLDSRFPSSLFLHVDDPKEGEILLSDMIRADDNLAGSGVYNVQAENESTRRIILIAEIFLYGFIAVITLIGVTNIFNTVTTNMNLRRREFAMLRSVGMTKREFNRMVRLESLLYGMKSLGIGIPLGLAGSVIFYVLFHNEFDLSYVFPAASLILSAVFVFVIVGLTMRYSLAKINKQNIIETIRNENI